MDNTPSFDYLQVNPNAQVKSSRSESELLASIITIGILVTFRFTAIFYFIMIARRLQSFQGEQKDRFTYWTLVMLAGSQFFHNLNSFLILIFEIFNYLDLKNSDKYHNLTLIQKQYESLLNILYAISRQGIAYQLQNLALLINIHRWERILMAQNYEMQNKGGITVDPKQIEKVKIRKAKSKQISTNLNLQQQDHEKMDFINSQSLQQQMKTTRNIQSLRETVEAELIQSQNYIHERFSNKAVAIIVSAILLASWQIIIIDYSNEVVLMYQGIIVNPFVIYGYYYIYQHMKSFHQGILDKFEKLYSNSEIERIRQSTKEIKLFFSYICIMLIMQILNLTSRFFSDQVNNSDNSARIKDVTQVLLMTSSIFMNYGIYSSIKRAFVAQIKNNRNIKKMRIQKQKTIILKHQPNNSINERETLLSQNEYNKEAWRRDDTLNQPLSGETSADPANDNYYNEEYDEDLISRAGSLFIDTNYQDEDDDDDYYTEVYKVNQSELTISQHQSMLIENNWQFNQRDARERISGQASQNFHFNIGQTLPTTENSLPSSSLHFIAKIQY